MSREAIPPSRADNGMRPVRSSGLPGWAAIGIAVALSALALVTQLALRRPHDMSGALVSLIMPPPATVKVWLSTADRRLRLARQPDIVPGMAMSTPGDIVIDLHTRFQTITGFGAALTDSSSWLIEHKLDAPQREAFLREIFGPPPGLNFNMTRLTIGASDFSREHYTLDDMPAGQTDPDLEHFNLSRDLEAVIPVVREALSINPNLRIIASPWSAPAWMKDNDALIGGTLLDQYHDVYANYLVKYVDGMRRYGVPIFALTVQNEPMFQPKTYPGMLLPADARADIIGQYLGPALARRRPPTLIFGWDHNWNNPQQPLDVLGDPDAARYISAIAWHCYEGAPSAQTRVHRAAPRKDVYVTECSGGDWDSAKNGELMWLARDYLLGSLRNWARGVIYWNLVLDEHHGPHAGGCNDCKGIVTLDTKTGAIHRNDEYYAFAHYSRFVLPGAVRVWSSANTKEVANVAFQNADHGSVVLVVVNSAVHDHPIAVHQGDRYFQYTMPGRSVATFEWQPGQTNDAANSATEDAETEDH